MKLSHRFVMFLASLDTGVPLCNWASVLVCFIGVMRSLHHVTTVMPDWLAEYNDNDKHNI